MTLWIMVINRRPLEVKHHNFPLNSVINRQNIRKKNYYLSHLSRFDKVIFRFWGNKFYLVLQKFVIYNDRQCEKTDKLFGGKKVYSTTVPTIWFKWGEVCIIPGSFRAKLRSIKHGKARHVTSVPPATQSLARAILDRCQRRRSIADHLINLVGRSGIVSS